MERRGSRSSRWDSVGDRRQSCILEQDVTGPTSDEQIRFLVNLQRLLDEGLFVASYKFALLLSLADLSVERGDDSGKALPLTTEAIAEKFVHYYWRQAMPYPAAKAAAILRQNTGQQAAILNIVRQA